MFHSRGVGAARGGRGEKLKVEKSFQPRDKMEDEAADLGQR